MRSPEPFQLTLLSLPCIPLGQDQQSNGVVSLALELVQLLHPSISQSPASLPAALAKHPPLPPAPPLLAPRRGGYIPPAGSAGARCLPEPRSLLGQHELRKSPSLSPPSVQPRRILHPLVVLLSRSSRVEIRRGAGKFLLMLVVLQLAAKKDLAMRLVLLFLSIWAAAGAGSDMEALLEFGRGIRQDPSRREATPWNPTSALDSDGCPADWHGVQCNGGQILSIAFDGIGLVGKASLSALARMPMLRNLSLSGNKLEGVLPPELGSMASLQMLDLSNNMFSGSIPSELTKFAGLGYLNLSSNGFGGALPVGFRNLRKLKYLDLRGNGFTGKVGDIIAQLQSPVHVDLSCNQFSGSLASVSDNSSAVSTLQYLNVSHNMLAGTLFDSDPMPLFDSLEVFDASFNALSGNIPPFNFLISLKVLRLQNNNFSGSVPEALFRETSMVLTELDVSCNQLTGPIRRVTAMNLKYLNLSCNNLKGNLPITFGSCSVVDLSRNMLSGNLSVVRTWGNYIQMIDLSSNRLTGTWPDETTQFLRLTSLKISNNLLAGELPAVIGTYPELITVDLSLNQLHGPLPETLFTSVLTYMNLSSNSFSGTLPLPNSGARNSTSIDLSIFPVQPSNLSIVDLSNNSLSGLLPSGIGDLSALTLLNLSQNNFTGQIPKAITKLKNCYTLTCQATISVVTYLMASLTNWSSLMSPTMTCLVLFRAIC
ncbi:hypothetical protein PR202_ga25908 [Eleusine coracana subsp. coracana]|uniref:Leucine-rich repeat-containing N-terminal plant-type domain-containing protein n=1 Tax=Eleusine coracana subsp. coracana TaxID=191504 RepID=A0AAV5DAJ2_ELECO|nr:hypothetical protein PR202_ga25908 [Eleusine coracana subsp. coracana]